MAPRDGKGYEFWPHPYQVDQGRGRELLRSCCSWPCCPAEFSNELIRSPLLVSSVDVIPRGRP